MRSSILFAILLMATIVCQAQSPILDELVDLMTGEFSSAEQAASDSTYYDISLVMTPIWEGSSGVKWLYVEQALATMRDKPYRQRVYKVYQVDENKFASSVYTLPQPERFIQPWDSIDVFTTITPDSLMERDGCTVYLQLSKGCFTGQTKEKDCSSTLRGASYATSVVSICNGRVDSWDQGWNEDGEQVWGAQPGPYIFKRQE